MCRRISATSLKPNQLDTKGHRMDAKAAPTRNAPRAMTPARTLGGILPIAIAAWAVPAHAAITDAPKAEQTPIKVETIATGLSNPWGLQFLPDGRMLVTEKPGRMRIVSPGGEVSPPISGVPEVSSSGQGGLLDVRLAPDFAQSGTIYFSFSEPDSSGKSGTSAAKAKLALEGDSGTLKDVEVIFRQKPKINSSHHFGSRIVIAKDGSLFITTGDRGSMTDEVQDANVPVGKVIRIMPDGSPHPDNPNADGWAPEFWSTGHRNIQGAVLDPDSGELWTVEHGARGGDELNNPQAGKNYGWPVISYGRHYSGAKIGEGQKKAGMEQPVYYWDPSIATSGLEIYTGDLFAGWKGDFLVGGLAGTQIARLVMKDGEVTATETLLEDKSWRIRDVRQGPDGAVYALVGSSSGRIIKLTPAS
jgi:aldose sugar dehydrogenase